MDAREKIRNAISEYVECVVTDIRSGIYESAGEVDEEIYAVTDSVWEALGCSVGRFDDIDPGDIPDLRAVRRAVDIMAYCQEQGYAEHDSGMWEGLQNPLAIVLCMAYCALENAICGAVMDTDEYADLPD